MQTKNKILVTLVLFFLFLVPLKSWAFSCWGYNQPFLSTPENQKNILVYNCAEGVIKKIDLEKIKISNVSGTNDLGSVIHKIVWSPDGKNVLFLAENILPAKRVLKLFSEDRAIDSLNWWVYDLETYEAKILPEGIISAGWLDNSNLIYNFKNQSLKKLNTNNPSESVEVVNSIKGKNEIEDELAPVVMEKNIIFSMDDGFYVINKDTGESDYKTYDKNIKRVTGGSQFKDIFAIETESDYIVFDNQGNQLIKIGEVFKKTVFISNELILGVKNDGNGYILNTKTRKFEKYLPLKINNPGYLFQVNGEENILAITGEGDLYYLKNGDFKIFTEKEIPEQNISTEDPKIPSRKISIWQMIVVIITASIIVFFYVIWKIKKGKKY